MLLQLYRSDWPHIDSILWKRGPARSDWSSGWIEDASTLDRCKKRTSVRAALQNCTPGKCLHFYRKRHNRPEWREIQGTASSREYKRKLGKPGNTCYKVKSKQRQNTGDRRPLLWLSHKFSTSISFWQGKFPIVDLRLTIAYFIFNSKLKVAQKAIGEYYPV